MLCEAHAQLLYTFDAADASRQIGTEINLRLGAVRRLAYEAADCGLWDYISSKPAIGISDVDGAFDSHTLPPYTAPSTRLGISAAGSFAPLLTPVKHLNLPESGLAGDNPELWINCDSGGMHVANHTTRFSG